MPLKSVFNFLNRINPMRKAKIMRKEIRAMHGQIQWLVDFHQKYFDPTNAAAARGGLYLYQKSGAKILEIFDVICAKHKWRYWLDGGNLIGYLRHGGMPIPWDDDIDVSMPREDYEQALEIFPVLLRNSDLKGVWESQHYKFLFYRNVPVDFDIFPLDQYSERIPQTEGARKRLLNKIFSAASFTCDDLLKLLGSELRKTGKVKSPHKLKLQNEAALKKWNEIFMEGRVPAPDGTFVSGYECAGMPKDSTVHIIADYDWIFPLRRGKYMGVETNIPNKPELYANVRYGDYTGFPKDFHTHAWGGGGIFSATNRRTGRACFNGYQEIR